MLLSLSWPLKFCFKVGFLRNSEFPNVKARTQAIAMIGNAGVTFGVAAVRFLRGTLFAEVRLGITDLRVKSAVRQKRHYALFAAIRMKPNYALFSLWFNVMPHAQYACAVRFKTQYAFLRSTLTAVRFFRAQYALFTVLLPRFIRQPISANQINNKNRTSLNTLLTSVGSIPRVNIFFRIMNC